MIRFAVWAAVSSAAQVEGVSLENQLQKCRERGLAEKWVDTNLQYVADGYSRTDYENLSDAMADIPALDLAVTDMRNNKYDVLILWNYDRLGDVLPMMLIAFKKKQKQLFSVSQPTQIQENYVPYSDDASFMVQYLSPIWQRQRIADFRRKWAAGMPKRAKDGLPAGRTPFGYKTVEKGKPPVVVEGEAKLLRMIYDLLMEGKSFSEIANRCNKTGLRTRRGKLWEHSSISRMIVNPFYVGETQWPKTKLVEGKQIKNPVSKRVIGKGEHETIFTKEEHEKIIREISRRQERNQRTNYRFPFSGLLYCMDCKRKLYRDNLAKRPFLCENDKPCRRYRYDKIYFKIVQALQLETEKRRTSKKVKSTIKDYSGDIADLEARIERVQQSAELGVYTAPQALKRVSELQTLLENTYRKQAEREYVNEAQKVFDETLHEVVDMDEWISERDPVFVNRLLNSAISRILISPKKIDVEWR